MSDAEETVTVPPDAASVPERLLVLPTTTLPKESELGVAVNCRTGAVTPVPASGTVTELLEASLRIKICPEAAPAEVGENFAR